MRATSRRLQGFTLLEVLLVVAIAGIALGTIALNLGRSTDAQSELRKEGETIARLLELTRTEAILRNQETAFEADAMRYRFLVREETGWQPLPNDDTLRERAFVDTPMKLALDSAKNTKKGLRIVFGREPIDLPFVLSLNNGNAQIAIRGDGAGRFTVEQP